jgi:type II secretory pathway component PulK
MYKIKFVKMRKDSNNKGMVLIAVLWITVMLTVIAAMLGHKNRLDTKICMASMESVRCRWASRAGIETAAALLYEDMGNADSNTTDCIYDYWADPDGEYLTDMYLDRCWCTVTVTDESGKININTASRDLLLALPNMTEDIADAIIDWRDSDEEPGDYGVEGGYYENLAYPYLPRNAPFRTIRELLLVRDVTDELFYGEDTNLNGKLDYNERDGTANPPDDNGDDVLDEGWAAYLTCYTGSTADSSSTSTTSTTSTTTDPNSTGTTSTSTTSATGSGLVNVNTASDVVLAVLMGGTAEAYVAAESIIAYRETLLYGIEDPAELTSQGVITSDLYSTISGYLTISSNIFNIRSIATADRSGTPYGAQLETEVVIDRTTSPYKILYWYQGANN